MFDEGTLFLAPMAEVTHGAFRELIAHYGGCDYYASEMVSARAFLNCGPNEAYYLAANPSPERLVYQLVGGDEDILVHAAEKLAGERECFGIDINMGCTAPEIVKQRAGIMWMEDDERAARLIERVRRVTKGRMLSVKIRAGAKEDVPRVTAFVTRLAEAGLDYVTYHGRTKKEKLNKVAKWDAIPHIANASGIPVVGNGDVTSHEVYERNRARYAPAAVMIGRKAIAAPWFFAYLKERHRNPTYVYRADVFDAFTRFITLLEEAVLPKYRRSRLIKFFYYFKQHFLFGHHLYARLFESRTYEEGRAHVFAYFDAHPEERSVSEQR